MCPSSPPRTEPHCAHTAMSALLFGGSSAEESLYTVFYVAMNNRALIKRLKTSEPRTQAHWEVQVCGED